MWSQYCYCVYLQFKPYALGCRVLYILYVFPIICNKQEYCLLVCDAVQLGSTVSGNVNTTCRAVRRHKTWQYCPESHTRHRFLKFIVKERKNSHL